MDESILRRNLAALAVRQPDLATIIASTARHRHLQTTRSDNGLLTVQMVLADRRTRLLHSRRDPLREAERIADTVGPAATLICYGAGAAWLPKVYLSRHRAASAVVVESSAEALRTTLETVDIAEDLTVGRLYVVCTLKDLGAVVASIHHPTLQDRLVQHRLTGRDAEAASASFFDRAAACVRTSLAASAEDGATVRRFARAWFVHTVANTRTVPWAAQGERLRALTKRFTGRRAAILAAGPTLDHWFETGAAQRHPVAVVDTAYPALRARDIAPEMVVSIDPQGWTCSHLARGVPRPTTLVADLGVSPLVFASAASAIAIAGPHPLHQLLFLRGFPVPFLAQGVQTVTEATVLVARGLGAEAVELIGADGAFPRGATYARGTHHHRFSAVRTTRLRPHEHFFAERVYPSAERIPTEAMGAEHATPDGGRGPVFSQSSMRAARTRLSDLGSPGITVPPLAVTDGTRGVVSDIAGVRAFWRDHIERLDRAIEELSDGRERSTPEVLERVGLDGRAHLPLVAAWHRRGEVSQPAGRERFAAVLETVRAFLFKEIDR